MKWMDKNINKEDIIKKETWETEILFQIPARQGQKDYLL